MFCKKRVINDIVVPETIEIINFTTIKNIEPIVKLLAYKVFEFDKIRIRLNYLPAIFNSGDFDYWGVAQKMIDGPQSYQIFLKKNLTQSSLRGVLAHEFVHIDQYNSGDLQVTGAEYIWKGESGNMYDVEYKRRPFELDAGKRSRQVLKDLKKILYK